MTTKLVKELLQKKCFFCFVINIITDIGVKL